MRIAHWKACLFCSLLSLSVPGGIPPADAGEPPVRRNAALPDPDDLIVFDDAPAVPDPSIASGEAIQAAFPVFYGTLPVTTSSDRAREPLVAPVPPSSNPFADAASSASPGDLATRTSSAEGFVDYAEYLKSRAETQPSAPASSSTPTPTPDLPELAMNQPVPLPPPAELVEEMRNTARTEGAAALPAGRATADPVPSISATESASRALDGTPLPPPPLPELAAKPADAPTPAPVPAAPVPSGEVFSIPAPPPTIEQVRAEFSTLKTYCEADSLGSAAEIYARMPDFGNDDELNRLRADAANLLILGLARSGNLAVARRVYESVPTDMPGFDARLAKARAVINLTTYYIRAEQYTDAFAVLMDVGKIQNRSALNNELFRLMARMIPYLDNAEETDKARRIYDLLLSEVKSPGTAALFAENIRASVLTYYFHYVDNSDSPVHRRKRLDFLEHVFSSLDPLLGNTDVRALKRTLGQGLAERYAGDPDRAAQFEVDI